MQSCAGLLALAPYAPPAFTESRPQRAEQQQKMATTLKDWLLYGLSDELNRSDFASAAPVAAPQLTQKRDDATNDRNKNGLSRATNVDDTLQIVPRLPLAMLDHLPSVLAKWRVAANALAAPAESFDNFVRTAHAELALNATPSRLDVARYWKTVLLAVQIFAARLQLPLLTTDVDSRFGTTIVLHGSTRDSCWAVIRILTDEELSRYVRGPENTGNALDIGSSRTSTHVGEQELRKEVRSCHLMLILPRLPLRLLVIFC